LADQNYLVHRSLTLTLVHTWCLVVCIMFVGFGCELERQMGLDAGRTEVDPNEPFECSGDFLSSFPEACDGVDDDCDGLIDEGIESCSVPRADLPFKLCNANCCVADAACAEGEVCETLGTQGRCSMPCEDGELRLCSFGCEPTFQRCVGRVWAPCDAVEPMVEACNGLDDDCDGRVDEDPKCAPIDLGVSMDQFLGHSGDTQVADAEVSLDVSSPDLSVDAAVVDAAVPEEPECRSHAACPSFQLCFGTRCRPGLPGSYNLTIYSARIGDLPGDSPDMFAELRLGMNLLGTTETVDDDDSPTWNYRVRTNLESQQILEVCVSDSDGFLNADDLAGCSQFSSESIVERIRTFNGTRLSPNWASFSPQITSGESLDSLFLHVDRL
jgi:hypothetical protein